MALRAALDTTAAPLGRAAAAFMRARAWTAHGYARLEDHARERFHRSGRWLRNLADIGRACDELPGFVQALTGADGGRPLPLAAAHIVATRATASTVDDWIARARTQSVRSLRTMAEPEVPAPETRRRVEVTMPAPAREAFDEGLQLHRAVEGCEASVSSYVEALLAEHAASGGEDLLAAPALKPATRAVAGPDREQRLEMATRNWSKLRSEGPGAREPAADRMPRPDWLPCDDLMTRPDLLPCTDLMMRPDRLREHDLPQPTDLPRACSPEVSAAEGDDDGKVLSLLAARREIEQRLDLVLARMGRVRAWSSLRFAGLGHYAEERLGMSRTSARERARLARGLEGLPELRAAYERGEVGTMAALEVVRLLADEPGADEQTRRAWVERARRATVKRLRDETRILRRQGIEDAVPASRQARCEPRPLDDARWHAGLSRRTGDARARVARLAALARQGAPSGRAWPTRRLALWLEPDLARSLVCALGVGGTPAPSAQNGRGAPGAELPAGLRAGLPAAPWAAIRAGLRAGDHSPSEEAPERMFSIVSRGPSAREGCPPATAGFRATETGSRALETDSRPAAMPPWQKLLAMVEDYVATWDVDQSPQRPSRIAIYVRDGWRCMAPGCTSRRNLEDHHVMYRSHGGNDGLDNRVCLCRFHHQRGEHGELARVRGRAPLALQWSLGRGGRGGAFRNEMRLFDRLC